jgi:tetratricopeptide (TPR) repeat protein
MSRFDEDRWLPALVLLAALVAVPPALPAQAPEQPPVPAAAPPLPAAAAPAVQPTPEQLGDALVARQRYQAAIAAYSKAPAFSATLWNKMGIAYQMMFNVKDAARCYKASLKIDPNNPTVINNLATLYDSQKQYGLAERMYRKALKLDPHSALILKNLGSNLMGQHKYKKGSEAYQAALAIDPDVFEDTANPKVQNPASVHERGAMNYYMARGCARSGQTECALQYLRMAMNEGYTNPKKIAADEDFASLRGLPAFQQLLASQAAPK